MEPGIKKIEIDVDLEKFRWSLVGDGYIRDEVVGMSDEILIHILKQRITNHIDSEYNKGKRLGLYDEFEEDGEE